MSDHTVTRLSDLYRKVNDSLFQEIAMIPDGGYERAFSVTANGLIPIRNEGQTHRVQSCSYCKRERGQFPTCDGCGGAEFV